MALFVSVALHVFLVADAHLDCVVIECSGGTAQHGGLAAGARALIGAARLALDEARVVAGKRVETGTTTRAISQVTTSGTSPLFSTGQTSTLISLEL